MDCEPNPVKCWSTPHVICSERRGEWRFSRQLKLQTRTEPQLPRVASQNMLVAGMVFPNSVHVEPKIQTPSSQHQGKLAKQKALGPSDDHVCVCSIVRTPRPPSNFGLLRLFQRVLGRSPYFNTHAYYINVSSNPLLVRTFLHPIEKTAKLVQRQGELKGEHVWTIWPCREAPSAALRNPTTHGRPLPGGNLPNIEESVHWTRGQPGCHILTHSHVPWV